MSIDTTITAAAAIPDFTAKGETVFVAVGEFEDGTDAHGNTGLMLRTWRSGQVFVPGVWDGFRIPAEFTTWFDFFRTPRTRTETNAYVTTAGIDKKLVHRLWLAGAIAGVSRKDPFDTLLAFTGLRFVNASGDPLSGTLAEIVAAGENGNDIVTTVLAIVGSRKVVDADLAFLGQVPIMLANRTLRLDHIR